MKIILNLLCFFFFCNLSFAQQVTFEKHYNFGATEEGYCVQQTFDGGYIIAGRHTIGIGSEYMLLQKTDSLGQIEWTKFIGGAYESEASSVIQTSDSGYIVTGWTTIDASYYHYISLIKTDPNGDTLWTKRYIGSTLNSSYSCNCAKEVQPCSDGGYIITANITEDTDTLGAILLVKTNSVGDTLWTHKYKTPLGVQGNSVKETNDSGFVIAGYTVVSTFPFLSDDYLIKVSSIGAILWTKRFNLPDNEQVASVIQSIDGGYLLNGTVFNLSNSYTDIYLIKTNPNGDTLWSKKIGGLSDESGKSVAQTSDNGFIITGFTDSYGLGGKDVFLIKINANGNILWTKTFGGVNSEYGNFVQETYDRGFIITGFTSSSVTGDVYLIKTDSTGNAVIAIDELTNMNNYLVVYPNPSNGKILLVSQDLDFEIQTISLFNSIGEKIFFSQYKEGQSLDFSEYPNGFYLLNISMCKIVVSKKIIINH